MFAGDAGMTAKDCADRDMAPSARAHGSREGESWADEVVAAACSFSGDTDVLMADGSEKPISQLQVGDEVLAADPEAGTTADEAITALWVHQDTLVTLNTAAGPIRTTENHPFWNASDQAWQPAEEIDPGEAILTSVGDEITVYGLDWSAANGGMAYNLTVAELHTYFVVIGDDAVLVHNSCRAHSIDEIAESISGGHAWADHHGEFSNVEDQLDLENLIAEIIQRPSASKKLSNGREAFWDDATGVLVIYDPKSSDLGTVYVPDNGRTGFINVH